MDAVGGGSIAANYNTILDIQVTCRPISPRRPSAHREIARGSGITRNTQIIRQSELAAVSGVVPHQTFIAGAVKIQIIIIGS